jgi:ubiquinone/menaquinone biosynthesis C-methylase UbiE
MGIECGTHPDEWNTRAMQRPGLQSVMSNRWRNEQCIAATFALHELILNMLGDINGKNILEIGPGIGRITSKLDSEGAKVTGVDLSHSMLVRAKDMFRSQDQKVLFVQAPAHQLPLPSGIFDIGLEVTVLQHITSDVTFRESVQEMQRTIKPEGLILLCDELSPDSEKDISPFTRLRTIDSYKKVMKGWKLIDCRSMTCVTDPYTFMLWRKS